MKRWYESKTIWLGLATIATAVMSAVAGGAGWQEAVGVDCLRISSGLAHITNVIPAKAGIH